MHDPAASFSAWRCHAPGDYHDLVIGEAPRRPPAAHEIVIANRAFAVGFPDMLMVQGLYQLKPPPPFTPAAEFAGVVAAVGADVRGFRPGDRVMGTVRYGAAAAEVVVPADDCLPLPDAFDFAAGAAYLVGTRTAWVALVVRGGLRAGETVLVHGAAGGVGLPAVALARARGAEVIAVATGEDKCAVVRARGAHHVLDRTAGPLPERVKALTGGRGADVIYDPVGGDAFDASLHCIAPFGRILVVGFASGRIPQAPVNYPLIKQFAIVGVRAGEYGRLDPAGGRAVNAALAHLTEDARLAPHIHARLPFTGLVQAFDEIAARRVVGRIVLDAAS
jgi:NADPH2:quinone reductase